MAALLIVIIVIGANWYLLSHEDNRGTFGDMFGFSNALFSGLAFACLTFVIILQRKDINLQREELQLTRKELAGQKEQMEAQNATLRQQTFENTLFHLVRLLNEVTEQMELSLGTSAVTGRVCFEKMYARLRESFEKANKRLEGVKSSERITSTYLIFLNQYRPQLGHYFGLIYHIVKFVDESMVRDKRLYANLLRAQLSTHELQLLFYHALAIDDVAPEELKPFVEKYSLLVHLPRGSLLDSTHASLYSECAFRSEG